MASLNLSTNGPSITKSYQAVVNAAPASTGAAASPSYAQWAVFSVTTPLVNAFQADGGNKESVLKVQSSDEGELVDLIEDFSEGKIQFAFVKVKDPNTGLPKNVLIAWCGEGVPERTKGYFNSHLAAVSRFLQGYHVQITARSDRDLTPEAILQKVSDASGAKYSSSNIPTPSESVKPPVATKPVFTASRSGGVAPPPGARRVIPTAKASVDDDGWGADAPPVTRTELEKVPSAYKPTKVDINQLTSQKQPESRFSQGPVEERSDVVKGGYQPIGKVDIAAIRRQARETGQDKSDRPEVVKGAYEPVGKVDIAAIRAKAQPAQPARETPVPESQPEESGERKTLSERSAAFQSSERLTTLPKPKVANRFGGSSNFAGTKAPLPAEFGIKSAASAAPVTSTSRTFADEGGKTPAQLWAERKARERGAAPAPSTPSAQPVNAQVSGDGRWKSSYSGKSWAPVQTTLTGHSAGSGTARHDDEEASEPQHSAARDISATEEVPPPLDHSNKPNAGQKIPLPGLPAAPAHDEEESYPEEETKQNVPPPPPQPPRSPTPPTPADREPSPIQVAMPVSRTAPETLVQDAHDEQDAPPQPLPIRSLEQAIPHEDELEEEPSHDPGRAVAETSAQVAATSQSISAIVQYDYEKAEDNEVELKEGEYVTDIEMVDEDWWLGVNSRGERGLFPSNYVEIVEQASDVAQQEAIHHGHEEEEPTAPEPEVSHAETGHAGASGHTATAQYDYEAAEDNELSFPEGAKITNIEFPDEDWWSGEYHGKAGLFPANYVELDQ